MFVTWLKENNVADFDFSNTLFPNGSNREFWDSKYKEKYVKRAEKYLGFSWPLIKASDFIAFHTLGSRQRHEKPYFERRAAFCALILGELLENKGRFIPDIVDGSLLLCEETTWTLSAHKHPLGAPYDIQAADDPYIDIFAAETAVMLTLCHYLLGEGIKKYCPEMLERIEYEMERRITKPYLERRDFIWMCNTPGWKVDNWNPWILSNLLTVFLIMQKDREKLNRAIEKMLGEIQGIYNTYPSDGGCDEGATYWCMSQGAFFEFCDQLFIATNGKINFFNDKTTQNCGKYEYRAYIGNGYFTNFADGATTLKNAQISYILYMYGKRINDSRLSSLAMELKLIPEDFDPNNAEGNSQLRRMVFDLIYEDEIKALPDFEPCDSCILKDTQNAFVHKNGWFYAAKGGHNAERHNHYDVGSAIVYYNGCPVFVDSGSGTYNAKTFSLQRYDIWTMNSLWHNLPQINGFGQTGEYEQPDGIIYKADNFEMEGTSTHISFAKAYRKEAKIKTLDRFVTVNEDGVSIKDKFVFTNDKNTFCEHFITPLEITVEGNKAIIGNEFIVTADCEGAFAYDSVDFEDDEKLKANWNTDKMNRLKFTAFCGKQCEVTINVKRK